MKSENILVFCAHPDDEVFGLGGTIAKYAREKKNVIAVIFSFGELSMPWLKAEEVRKIRKKESLAAAKILGTGETHFLGLKEGKIEEEGELVKGKIAQFIKKNTPEKIFMHSQDDPHLDHRASHRYVLSVLKELNYKGQVYTFDVWNPLTIKDRDVPKLYVDVSKDFGKKLSAAKAFETQRLQGRWPLVPTLIWRGLLYGFKNGCRFAERFRKLDLS